jgi:hypothetical protein
MPAPLTVPAIVISLPDIRTLRTACLARVSVVMIALAKPRPARALDDNRPVAALIAPVIFFMGNCLPIIPVEATRTSPDSTPNCLPVVLHIEIASAIPFLPVQALALPELTTTP